MRKRVEPLVSSIRTTEKGLSTAEKKATVCSVPSSQSRKSSLRRFGMYLPSRSITLTGKVTSVVSTRMTSPASTSSFALAAGAVLSSVDFSPAGRLFPPKTGGREGTEARGDVDGVDGADGADAPEDVGCGLCPTRRCRVCACGATAVASSTERSKR